MRVKQRLKNAYLPPYLPTYSHCKMLYLVFILDINISLEPAMLLVINPDRLFRRIDDNLLKERIIIKNLDLLRQQGHPKWKEVIIPDEPGILFRRFRSADRRAE